MKFVVDAQLPKTLSEFLNSQLHDSIHTLELPKANTTPDFEITELAKREDRVVITKDMDFMQSHIITGKPSRLIL